MLLFKTNIIWSKTELKCTLKKFDIIIHENNKSKILSSHYRRMLLESEVVQG